MPEKYRDMGVELQEPFVSLIFAREPMDRLVSAWSHTLNKRDKNKNQYYHAKFGRKILEQKHYKKVPFDLHEAWDQGKRSILEYSVKFDLLIHFANSIKVIASNSKTLSHG